MEKVGTKKTTFAFPSLNVPEEQKNEDWHHQFVLAITNESLNNAYDLSYRALNEAYNFYQGLQTGDEFRFIQESENGESLPAQWINYNKIKNKVDVLIGELGQRGYDIVVKALNKDANVRRLEKKEQMRVDMKLKSLREDLEEKYGLPLSSGKPLPEDEEELDEYFDSNYKETSELIMESALKYISKKNDWDYERTAMFRDMLIAGRCFVKCEIKGGIPVARRVDPRFMIFDTNATDDFLSDSSFFGEVRYMTAGEAAEKYGLSKKQIEYAAKQYLNPGIGNMQNDYNTTLGTAQSPNLLDSTTLRFFKRERDELRVMVLSAVWKDFKTIAHKASKDKYGGDHYKRVYDIVDGKENVEKNNIAIWRQGTLIGGKFLTEWGEVPNQTRDTDDLKDTQCPYKALIPNYINGHGVSKVHQLMGLQKLKDITMYNVQLAMSRAGAKGFIYDVAQIPEDWEIEEVIKYLKTVGIAFIDSKKDRIPAQFNQFSQIDMTISSSVGQYLEISRMIDQEMDEISGVNDARQGHVQGASQAVGVTQSALFQSAMATSTLFNLFNSMSSKVLTHQAGLVKIAWAGKERFAPIIGDTGVDFLTHDVDLELNDYGVFIESIPPAIDDINMFHQTVMAALQSGSIDFVDAMKLMMEKDVKQGIRRFSKASEKKAKEEFEQQMQLQQQEQQAQLEREMQTSQAAAQNVQAQQQGAMALKQMDNKGKENQTLAKIKADLLKTKVGKK